MKSIRSYLLVRLVGGATLTLAAAGLAVYLVVARSLEAQFDRNLSESIRGLASLLFQVEDDVTFEFSDELMPEYDRDPASDYFELFRSGGHVLERSNSLAGRDLIQLASWDPSRTHWSAPLPDGRDGRFAAQQVVVHHVYPEQGPDRPEAARVVVVIARGREDLLDAERDVLLACAALSATLTAMISGLAWLAVDRGLAPARRLALQLDRIDVAALPPALDVGPLPAELAPVAEKADALVRRVDVALQRERRTSADIAHELRTPISELLTVAEIALRGKGDAESLRSALGSARDVAWRLGASVSTLLKLARLELGGEQLRPTRCDIAACVAEARRALKALERERGISVECAALVDADVVADADALRIVLSNLLSNAMQYAPSSSSIRIDFARQRGSWRVSIENDAPELVEADLRSIGEPFWRKDKARSDRAHSGLGLALSRALASAAQLTLEFDLDGGLFRATLRGAHAEVDA